MLTKTNLQRSEKAKNILFFYKYITKERHGNRSYLEIKRCFFFVVEQAGGILTGLSFFL